LCENTRPIARCDVKLQLIEVEELYVCRSLKSSHIFGCINLLKEKLAALGTPIGNV